VGGAEGAPACPEGSALESVRFFRFKKGLKLAVGKLRSKSQSNDLFRLNLTEYEVKLRGKAGYLVHVERAGVLGVGAQLHGNKKKGVHTTKMMRGVG
jgi:hypothetical protein